MGALVRPGRGGALGLGVLAHARLGGVRRGATSAPSCSSSSGLRAPAGRRAARAGGRRAAVGVHRRDGRRDRLPARHSGWTARGVWPGSKTTPRRWWPHRRSAGADRVATGHPLRPRVVRLSGHDASRARRRVADAAGRRRRRDRRRERRRQDHAGQAARRRCTSRRPARSSSTRRRSRGMPADEWRARLAGAFQDFFRFEFVARHDRRPRRRAAGSTTSPRSTAAVEPRRRRRRRRTSAGAGSRRSSGRPGRAASRCRSANGRSSRWRAASCATSRCCWCSTSRPRRSTPRPSTRCSSATPRPHVPATGRRTGRITHAGVAPLLDRAHGRSHRRPRRRATGRRSGTHEELMARRRPVRRAVRHPGGRLSLTGHARRVDRAVITASTRHLRIEGRRTPAPGRRRCSSW